MVVGYNKLPLKIHVRFVFLLFFPCSTIVYCLCHTSKQSHWRTGGWKVDIVPSTVPTSPFRGLKESLQKAFKEIKSLLVWKINSCNFLLFLVEAKLFDGFPSRMKLPFLKRVWKWLLQNAQLWCFLSKSKSV